ncbi:MAG TPA: ABC transporter ATP-binding protein [Solirubrobacteraceae bacterium]|nr:ABC transporter ATP-binding protein [Solirubrobacteraceae bacterium]
MAAVRASGVVKRFGTTCALDGVDLVVDEGEVRGLLGPNGAGKTTLLRILFGLMEADAGSAELFGRTPSGGGSDALAGVAGFVEDPSFYPYLSGRANLELLSELDDGVPPARVDEVLERVGLAHRGSDRVSGYSTGMKQRLGIAAALLRGPRLLMLDEPTAGLDPEGVREVGEMVRELASQRVAFLMSSHQIGEIEGVCDSFTFLRLGRVVWSGTAAELRSQAPASGYRLETSDDRLALELAERSSEVEAAPDERGGLALAVDAGALDPYVLALGAAGVAVRRLELTVSPLESMFFALTAEGRGPQPEIPDPVAVLDRALTGT